MPIKIVVVDDEPHIRLLLEQILEDLYDQPLQIFSAGDGAEALTVIKREKPQLVFLDVMIPKMNGFEVCAAVKSDLTLSSATIILVTAKGQEADREMGMKVGATKYITKPFDPDEILELTRQFTTA